MADLAHDWGTDLAIGPDGDLLSADADTLGRQRVLRRLLTNAGDYIWQPGYGAGLAQFVGSPAAPLAARAVIRSQIFREAAVATTPEPAIDVTADAGGGVYVQLRYTDAATSAASLLTFSVDG